MSGTGLNLVPQNAAGGRYVFMALNTGNQGLLEQSYGALKGAVYGEGIPMELNRRPEWAVNDCDWRSVA